MAGVQLRRVGEICVSDLTALARYAGHDGLPYPFSDTRQEQRTVSVAERYGGGDLSVFRDWVRAYVTADIWVTCRVHHAEAGTEDRRILGYRHGELGYLASQHGDRDVVEVSTLPAAELGAAIAESVDLSQPGRLSRIVVPGYVGYFAELPEVDDEDEQFFSVRRPVSRRGPTGLQVVADDDVAAVTTIQSRWQPARAWGVDWTRPVIAYLQIGGDGDYLYTPDFAYAVPMTEQSLCDRIDRLIADDLNVLWDQRGSANPVQ